MLDFETIAESTLITQIRQFFPCFVRTSILVMTVWACLKDVKPLWTPLLFALL